METVIRVITHEGRAYGPDGELSPLHPRPAACPRCGGPLPGGGFSFALLGGEYACWTCVGNAEVSSALRAGQPIPLYYHSRNVYTGRPQAFPGLDAYAATWTGIRFGEVRFGRVRDYDRDPRWKSWTSYVKGSKGGRGCVLTIHPPDGSIWAGIVPDLPRYADLEGHIILNLRRVRPPCPATPQPTEGN